MYVYKYTTAVIVSDEMSLDACERMRSNAIECIHQRQHNEHIMTRLTAAQETMRRGVRLSCNRMQLLSRKRGNRLENRSFFWKGGAEA